MKEALSVISPIAEAWQYTMSLATEDPVYGSECIRRLNASSPGKPVMLFVPWGVRPEGSAGQSECQALDFLAEYQQNLAMIGIPSNVLIMPADVYAIEVNGYDWEPTTRYFNFIWKEAQARNFSVSPWSQIRKDNQDFYDQIIRWRANLEMLWKNMPKSIWYNDLLSAAYRRSTAQTDQEIKASAFRYLRERVAEATIIESVYKPVKLSMVSPKKDTFVDCELPRLYLLPA